MNPDENVEVPPIPDGTIVERINKEDMQPLFDTNHEHEFIKDEEETEGYFAETCIHCPLGHLVAK